MTSSGPWPYDSNPLLLARDDLKPAMRAAAYLSAPNSPSLPESAVQ